MKTLRTFPGQRVALGHQGENLALTVIFNIGAWADAYGPGTVHLSHKRSCDEEACPVAVTQEGTEVFWNVTSGDTAADGYGKYELRYVVGETVVKSSVGETYVRKALQYGTQPPEPVQGWLDHVAEKENELLEAVADAKEFSEKASGAADNALTQATAAGESARNAALATKNAMDFAGNADLSAKDAAAQAGAAADYAADAKKAAEEAKKAAEDFGGIKTVNGQGPDENGNVEIDAGGVKTVNGVEPDADGNVQIEVGSSSGVDVTAKPGQLIRVKEVDEEGKPTAWEAVPWGWVEPGEMGEIVHKLPGKFLPDGVPYVEQGELVEILPECQPEYAPEFMGYLVYGDIDIELGKTYTVNWSGTEYECTTVMGEGFMFGNLASMGGEDTGEPFVGAYIPKALTGDAESFTLFIPVDGSTNPTVSIYQKSETIHKIDPRCLPDGMADNPFVVVSVKGVDETAGAFVMSHTAEEIYKAMIGGKIVFMLLEGHLFTTNGEVWNADDKLDRVGLATIFDPTLVVYVDSNGLLILPG